MCRRWPTHPKVRLLTFVTQHPWLDIENQHNIIVRSIAEAFPETKKVQFAPYFEWTLCGSDWRVHVLDRNAMKELIQKFAISSLPDDVKDHQDVLVKLFDSKELESLPLRSLFHLKLN